MATSPARSRRADRLQHRPASWDRRRPEESSPPRRSAAWAGRSTQLAPRDDAGAARPRSRFTTGARSLDHPKDLVSGEIVFFCATGVTDGTTCSREGALLPRRLHRPFDRCARVRHRRMMQEPPAFKAQRILRDRLHRRQRRVPLLAPDTQEPDQWPLTDSANYRIEARHHGRSPGAGKKRCGARKPSARWRLSISGRGGRRPDPAR